LLGILPIDKPVGITSHDVVNRIRRRFGIKRVGHSGTLDPLATGVLVLAVGPATRFLQYLPLEPKVYLAGIQFGVTTDTYDREGAQTASGAVPADLIGALAEIRLKFLGLVEQIPPMHSAVKFQGRPLYRYAREGRVVARDPRIVHIAELDIQPISESEVLARVVCSGGTYIRTLANDLGAALGCGAHLSSLQRTGVGKFHLDGCIPLDQATPEHLIPLAEALPPMPLVHLDQENTRHLREGQSVRIDCTPSNNLVALVEPSGAVFSVARLLGNMVQPECVIPGPTLNDASIQDPV
jgi:tRNA pseudouridine55 synthase